MPLIRRLAASDLSARRIACDFPATAVPFTFEEGFEIGRTLPDGAEVDGLLVDGLLADGLLDPVFFPEFFLRPERTALPNASP